MHTSLLLPTTDVFIWQKEKPFNDENALWHPTYAQGQREIINDSAKKEKGRRRIRRKRWRTGMLSNCLSLGCITMTDFVITLVLK